MNIQFRKQGYFARLYEKCTLMLECDLEYSEALIDISKMCQPDLLLNIEITEAKKKRSTNANAYAWVLIGKLASALGCTPMEVYKQQVLDMFTYRDVLIEQKDIEKEKKEWEKGHLGRLLGEIGPSREHEGWIWCRKYRSSSDYDTLEMSKFIDLIVFECIEQGIETKAPAEIEKLKSAWKG